MSLSAWLRRRSRLTRSAPRRPRNPRARPSVEPLEDRVVPATNLGFSEFANVAGVDTSGNVYVTGSVNQTADLDPGPGTSWLTGGSQYLAKYTPAKQLLWVTTPATLFGAADAQIRDVATYSANGQDFVYVMEASSSGSRTITRFQDTGTGLSQLWRTRTAGYDNIAVGTDGAVYMSNVFGGTLDFDPDHNTPGDTLTSDGQDGFLARWDASGTFQWVRQLGGTQNEWVTEVAVVNDGVQDTIYVGGYFNGTFAPQGYTEATLTDQGVVNDTESQDGFLAAYDTSGTFVSVGQFVDAWVRQVAGDASGTYLAGTHYQAALGFPGNRQDDLFFGKLDAGGQTLAWVQGIAGPYSNNSVNELLLHSGSLLLTGSFGSPFGDPLDFDPGAGTYNLVAGGSQDGYVASYSASGGAFQWARQMGSNTGGGDGGSSLAVSGSDLYVGGTFGPGQATFGTDTLTNSAGLDVDAFVSRMGTDGTWQWNFSISSVVRTIDNGDAGYSESGSGWKNNTAVGSFNDDARYHAKGSGSNKATWSFSGLLPGTYEVLTTWRPDNKNASNARFTVTGSSVTTVTRSQKVAPATYHTSDYRYNWDSLGTFTVGSNGLLTVSLSDQADGNVVADAIRAFLRTPGSPLLASATPATSSSEVLSPPEVQPLVQEAIARWEATGLTAVQMDLLHSVSIQIADLGGTTLGLESGTTILIDDNAAGWGWFIDPTPSDDNEFRLPGDQGEQNHMDLLTVVMHEMGHVLGLDHEPRGVMQETLDPGTRLSPSLLDLHFAGLEDMADVALALGRHQP